MTGAPMTDPSAFGPSGVVSATRGQAVDDGAGNRAGDGVVISPMRRRHLRAVVAIEKAANPHPWSHALFAGELTMPTSRYWVVARRGRQVVGFAGLMVTLDEGHITNFAVHEGYRRMAIGSRMLLAQCREAADREVRDITLEVRASNQGAQALYRHFGFAPGGIRPGYYKDNGEDAIIMWANEVDSEQFAARLDRIQADLPAPLVIESAGER